MTQYEQDRFYRAMMLGDTTYYDVITEEDMNMLFCNKLRVWSIVRGFINTEFKKTYDVEGIVYNPNSKPLVYENNSRLFRSPEFKSGVDILALGCSQTYGMGIEKIENTWPDILSKKSNFSYNSIAVSGDSVSGQIKKAYAYFKEFGHPKIIVAVFPDFNRFEFVENKQRLIYRSDKYYQSKKSDLSIQVKHWKDLADIPKVSKMPHDIRDVITQENGIYQATTAINAFEQYCELAGIKFLWGTWCHAANPMIEKIKKMDTLAFPGFVDIEIYKFQPEHNTDGPELYYDNKMLENEFIERGDEIKCHQEYEHLDDFYSGVDRYYSNPESPRYADGHAGVHKHIHWADIFLNCIKDKAC